MLICQRRCNRTWWSVLLRHWRNIIREGHCCPHQEGVWQEVHPSRQSIMGRNCAGHVTHETKHFINFSLGQWAIFWFKSGLKHGLGHIPSDPSKNKDCSLNSKYQRLKSSVLLKGTPRSLNLYCVVLSRTFSVLVCCGYTATSKIAYICTYFLSIPLCPMFFLLKIYSFTEINRLEKYAFKKQKTKLCEKFAFFQHQNTIIFW